MLHPPLDDALLWINNISAAPLLTQLYKFIFQLITANAANHHINISGKKLAATFGNPSSIRIFVPKK
jgi:hypothetical protein